MTARIHPSRWYRVEQRGCTPNAVGCLHLDWPIERKDLRAGLTVRRHVIPKDVLRYGLDNQTYRWETWREGRRWYAEGTKTMRSKTFATSGATEREAMQNLCEGLRVKLP